MTKTQTAFVPSDSLLELLQEINDRISDSEAYDTSPDGPMGDFVESFGYGDNTDLRFDELRDDELAAKLKTWYESDERACANFLSQHITVECHEMYTQWSEIYSASIGETEHQFDDLNDEIELLSDEEKEYLIHHCNAYTNDLEWFYLSHGCDRMVAILDERSAIKALREFSIENGGRCITGKSAAKDVISKVVYAPLRLVKS